MKDIQKLIELDNLALQISQTSEYLGKQKVNSVHFKDTTRYLQKLIKRYIDLDYEIKRSDKNGNL